MVYAYSVMPLVPLPSSKLGPSSGSCALRKHWFKWTRDEAWLGAVPCADVLKQLVVKRFRHGESLLSAGAKDCGQEGRLCSDGGCRP